MLKNIHPLLTSKLLSILAEMGHGDEIVIADANFPAAACAQRLVDMPGISATDLVQAICTVFPLDDFIPNPAAAMAAPGQTPAIYAEFEGKIEAAEGKRIALDVIDRFDFYTRAQKAYAVVASGERRLYGNIILKKGVVRGA